MAVDDLKGKVFPSIKKIPVPARQKVFAHSFFCYGTQTMVEQSNVYTTKCNIWFDYVNPNIGQLPLLFLRYYINTIIRKIHTQYKHIFFIRNSEFWLQDSSCLFTISILDLKCCHSKLHEKGKTN